MITVVFHEDFYDSTYADDPAAASGRLTGIMQVVDRRIDLYNVIEAMPAEEEDILRVHAKGHVNNIARDEKLYDMSLLAAGGSIIAAEEAYEGNPTFAVVRPPGHHASGDSCWGFCYFNNISVSLLKLFNQEKIRSAFVLDFDLHTGDGNLNILESRNDLHTKICNPMASDRFEYLEEVEDYMKDLEQVDIFVASAGFDHGIDDWGGLLFPEDYKELGRLMKEYSEKLCEGRRYALLEGGYNHDVLGMNFDSFCEGFN